MGVFSELDFDQEYKDSPFARDGVLPAFSEEGPALSVFPGEEEQQTEAADVPETLVEAQDKAGNTDPDTDAARQAHEEAEAKRKAEWEARQAQKKAAEQEQLSRLASMSDDEAMAASMKRVDADTEKLTRRNMKECVAEYIQTACLGDAAFARRVMHPRKSMIHCFQYINRKAWEYIQDELKASGVQPGPGQELYGSDISDDLCYQWAVDYFNDSDAKEDQAEEEKFVPRPYYGAPAKPKHKARKAEKAAAQKEKKQKSSANEDQISLGDFAMPEEKAG